MKQAFKDHLPVLQHGAVATVADLHKVYSV